MSELAKSQIDILLEIKNKRTLYTIDDFDDKFREPNVHFLYQRGLIKNDYTEEDMYYFLLTPLGEIEVDKHLNKLANEAKEDKRWNITKRQATWGVIIGGLGILASLVMSILALIL